MSKNSNSLDYVCRVIRLGEDYHKLLKWLEYTAADKDIGFSDFLSNVFSFSLDYLDYHEFNYQFLGYTSKRKPRGINVSSNVLIRFYSKYEILQKLKDNFYIADLAELVLFIYCSKNVKKSDLKKLRIDWHIVELF